MQVPVLTNALGALRKWKGFETFEEPGSEYLEVERNFKVSASKEVRTLFEPSALRRDLDAQALPALAERLRAYVRLQGVTHLMGWRDIAMVYDPVLNDMSRWPGLQPFFEAVLGLLDDEPDIVGIANQMAASLHGPNAGGLKSHMWSAISCICAMVRPDRYLFVKPRITDAFFRRTASPYRRPKHFSGEAYLGLLAECEKVVEMLDALGCRPKDMIDLQSFIWVLNEGVADEPVIRDLLQEAVEELTYDRADGATEAEIAAYLDKTSPREDRQAWRPDLLLAGEYAIWADTQEPCHPSTKGERFLVRTGRVQPYRYRLLEDVRLATVPAAAPRPDLYTYFRECGLWMDDEVLTNYVLALKTKPFVILTGISGTGKTKIAQVFAAYMCADEPGGAVDAPENGATTFYLRVGKTFVNHRFIRIPVDARDYFEELARGVATDVELRVDGAGTFTARLHNIGFADEARESVRLNFRREFCDWARTALAIGDVLEFEKGDGYYRVRKYTPSRSARSHSGRYDFVSVRPDWTDNRGLLGYHNPLLDTYVLTGFLKLMLRATKDPGRPYFVILDEMNLAKVEHYFSDFLSCLESRRYDGHQALQEAITLHDQPHPIEVVAKDGTYEVPARLEIPWNLYFTGTVNVDESTYMFSPKVLDRANTIEFNHVDLAAYGGHMTPVAATGTFRLMDAPTLGTPALAVKDEYDAISADTKRVLERINAILMPAQLHFGYRVANEIALYLRHAATAVGPEAGDAALDLQILQKVLPKLHGSRAKLEAPLSGLLRFLVTGEAGDAGAAIDWVKQHQAALNIDGANRLAFSGSAARYPRAAAKVWRMLQAVRSQGFASYVT